MQKRVKWTDLRENLAEGDLVLVCDSMTPRHIWPLALVKEVIYSRDGLVRAARLKTRSNEITRPLTKIVLLEAKYED